MSERHILSFPIGRRRFNYRVAAVIIVLGHVLVCREDEDKYCMLPGGRVELGERSDIALGREIGEELATTGVVGRMLFSAESFYGRDAESFHELSFFYEVTLDGFAPPDGRDPILVREDEGHLLQFAWVRLDAEALRARRLLPDWLCDRLIDLPETMQHVIVEAIEA